MSYLVGARTSSVLRATFS